MIRARKHASDVTKSVLTSVVSPIERRRATRFRSVHPLRLHLGSATNRLPGWVNVDLLRPGRRLDLYWDLRRGIPFPDGSVDAIFAEHLLEHLELSTSIAFLRECRRALRRGGTVRIGVPDLDRYVASYLGHDDLIDQVRPGRPTRGVALGEIFFLDGHKSMYDFQTLRWAFQTAGFTNVEHCGFGNSRIEPAPDSQSRRAETLYAEAWDDAPSGPQSPDVSAPGWCPDPRRESADDGR